ncbi:MAG TPA: hypothetical protein VK171_01530 [Fimbriimonas sp.]|nr:hypothetical protein [Fimbriimonas sp.]
MANFLNADLVVKELSARCQLAWTLTNSDIYDYQPLEIATADHVVIIAQGATYGDGGAQCKSYQQQFSVAAQFAYPASQTATEFRTAKANSFLTQIYKARHFMDGSTPLGGRFNVTDVAFDDIGEDHARMLEIRFSFFIETLNVPVPVTP